MYESLRTTFYEKQCDSFFNCCRLSRDSKLENLEQKNLISAVEQSKVELEAHKKSIMYVSFEEFITFLNSFDLPKGWFKIIDELKVRLFKLIYSPGPTITYSMSPK